MFAPVATGFGATVSVTERSGTWTVEVVVAVLFAGVGSVPVSATVTVLEMTVPEETAVLTWTTTVNVDEADVANAPVAEHEIEPVPPTAGKVPQVQPAGMLMD